MLEHPRAEHNVQRFFSSWLQLDGGQLHHALEDTDKDAGLFPNYDAALRTAMRVESEAFVRRAFFESGRFDELFSGNYAYVNGPLAELYGTDAPADPDSYHWVELEDRGGLFNRAAFLTVLSTANVTAPIRRGVWVLKEALCMPLGDPPPNVDDSPVEGGEKKNANGEIELMTVRQDVEARTAGATCQGCHAVINPVGFTFENFDAIGRWQTHEASTGLPVDASGQLQGTDVDGELDGLALNVALAASTQVRSCFAQRWARAALGADQLDACAAKQIESVFAESGDMRELLLAVVASDAFRFVDFEEQSQ